VKGAIVLAMSGLLAAGVLHCALKDPPPGPQALATRSRTPNGVVVNIPAGTVDRAALIASLKEVTPGVVFLQTAADGSAESLPDRVSLAIDLQRELDTIVYVATTQPSPYSGKPIDELLKTDASFTTCHPTGPELDLNAPTIDKLRVCAQDASKRLALALKAANASTKIGCTVPHEPELVDNLTVEGRTKLTAFLHDAASPCADDMRPVAISPRFTPNTGDPDRAGVLLRETMMDSGVDLVVLRDGVGTLDAGDPRRAIPYYTGLRNALADREPTMLVLGSVDAFQCADPSCARAHPASIDRYLQQVCAARGRVDFMITSEYMQDLAGRPLVAPFAGSSSDAGADADAGAEAGSMMPSDVEAILEDVDAAAALRKGFLDWRDGGASCTNLDASK
jgi:hypothetical protein